MKDIETPRPYLCYPFGVSETLKQDHGIYSLTQIIEERSKTFFEPVIGTPIKNPDGQWSCDLYTYQNILDAVNALCHYFLKAGILPERTEEDGTKEMIVALVAPSNLDMLLSMLAVQRLGLGVLLITPNQTSRVITHLCSELKVLKVLTPLSIEGLDVHCLPPSRVWQDAIRQPGKSYERRLSPVEEGDTTGVVYHTSGTTSGLPKALPTKHKFLVSFCAHKRTPLATLTTTPLNTGGTADVCRSMSADAMLFLFPDSAPLTNANIAAARDVSSKALGREVRALSCVPYVAKMLAEDDKSLAMLQRLEFLGVGGAPLPKATGDFIVNAGIPLVSRMGSSECNFLMCSYRDYENDKDWDYLRSEPGGHHFNFIPQNDGTGNCELEVLGSWPALATATNHNGNFRTGDLFQPHPTTPNAWLYLGRNDDTIVLGNGKKADPKALEGALRGLKYLNNALVFGTGKNNIGILVIELADETAPKGEELREKVWNEVIRKLNKQSPAHAEVYREMILTLPSSEDFEKTPKGTVFRNGTYAKFEKEINAAYNQGHQQIEVTDDDLDDYINKLVCKITEKQLDKDQDLFGAGVNSLQSVRIRNIIAGELGLQVPTNIVFEEPTISQLTTYIRRLRTGQSGSQSDKSSLMQTLVNKYSLEKSRIKEAVHSEIKMNGRDTSGEVILLTGATGGLGSHLLSQFTSTASHKIEKIVCLIRKSDAGTPEERARETMAYRKVDVQDSQVPVQYLFADLSKGDLGLGNRFTTLRDEVTLIIHAAWPVNFNASLSSFDPSIVSAVHLLELARLSAHLCRFYFCSSTASIINNKSQPIPEIASQDTVDCSTVGYAQSKWVTEQVVQSYSEVISVGILRIGQLCGDTKAGVWSESEAWSLMFKSVDVIHALPALVEDNIAWLPVDLAARSIIDIVLGKRESGSFWHIVNPGKGTTWTDVLNYFKSAGWNFDVVSPKDWVRKLKASPDSPDNASRKLLGLWEPAFDNDDPLVSDPIFDTSRAIEASVTLKDTKAVDQTLMTRIFTNWKERGFLA
ncbi:putative NRPS-like enzyme [Taphrina deformans PYCC 5710]|uniref:NRPS-like enzyme n=1 Tax=Taphrina deformans (strain PYCC 5710 / ATCC 11124 / CBS 356.35 / IMI 108563 / JCM 9778 / NBRC 8474) TaxID=1097556 RepID=R4X6D0_TAPDE|nr:putative NRPS-like enzyme [Taphrina deformans PYCC 5710]|eukprot:CCG80614.1 putative NRPS-like enzyme [Taphrina deformans PYCC 5710]